MKIYNYLIPLILLTIGSFLSMLILLSGVIRFNNELIPISYSIEHIGALILLIFNWILFIKKKFKKLIFTLLISTFLGALSLVWFTPLLFNLYWKFGFLELNIEPIAGLIFFLSLILNWNEVNKILFPD